MALALAQGAGSLSRTVSGTGSALKGGQGLIPTARAWAIAALTRINEQQLRMCVAANLTPQDEFMSAPFANARRAIMNPRYPGTVRDFYILSDFGNKYLFSLN